MKTSKRKKAIISVLVCTILFLMCLAGAKIYSLHQLLYAHAHDTDLIMCEEVIIVKANEKAIYFKYVDNIPDLEFYSDGVVQKKHVAYLREYTIIRDEWGRKMEWTDLEPGQRVRICVTSIVTHMYKNKKPYYEELFVSHDKCYEILIR